MPDTHVVDVTGCGNAFCGGFLAALYRNGQPTATKTTTTTATVHTTNTNPANALADTNSSESDAAAAAAAAAPPPWLHTSNLSAAGVWGCVAASFMAEARGVPTVAIPSLKVGRRASVGGTRQLTEGVCAVPRHGQVRSGCSCGSSAKVYMCIDLVLLGRRWRVGLRGCQLHGRGTGYAQGGSIQPEGGWVVGWLVGASGRVGATRQHPIAVNRVRGKPVRRRWKCGGATVLCELARQHVSVVASFMAEAPSVPMVAISSLRVRGCYG